MVMTAAADVRAILPALLADAMAACGAGCDRFAGAAADTEAGAVAALAATAAGAAAPGAAAGAGAVPDGAGSPSTATADAVVRRPHLCIGHSFMFPPIDWCK